MDNLAPEQIAPLTDAELSAALAERVMEWHLVKPTPNAHVSWWEDANGIYARSHTDWSPPLPSPTPRAARK